MIPRRLVVPVLVVLLLLAGGTATVIHGATGPLATVGSGFTYQGHLDQGGNPYDGSCDFQFRLYDAESGGSQVGTTQSATRPVSQGVFTANLDFGTGAFAGSARYLEVGVRCPAGSGSYQVLSPRQALAPAPYALYALSIPLAGSGVAETAARSDHDHAGVYQGKYARTVMVAPVGTDARASGTALLAALAGIADAGVSKPYLLKLEPGVYDLGISPLVMKAYVDVEGSGEGVTRVTRELVASANTGTVVGASNAELRQLTVESAGGSGTYAIGFYAPGGTTAAVRQVTIIAAGGSYTYGVYAETGSTPTLADARVTASGGTSFNIGFNSEGNATPILERVTAVASGGESYGMAASVGSPPPGMVIEIRNSQLTGGSFGLYANVRTSATGSVLVRDSHLSGARGLQIYSSTSANAVIRVQSSEVSGNDYGIINFFTAGPQPTNRVYVDSSQIRGATSTIYNTNGFNVYVGNSLLDGGAINPLNDPLTKCNFVTDETYNYADVDSCP